jgi:hypothetical protein
MNLSDFLTEYFKTIGKTCPYRLYVNKPEEKILSLP